MARRSIFAFGLVVLAMLALAAPALAGGWAIVTLDSLPRELRAGENIQLGFMVLQHGKTPTNRDLDGNPLTPVLKAIKQAGAGTTAAKTAETIHVAARQQGATGHYVVDVVFPSDGSWAWQIEVPTYFVQDSPGGQNAAIFAPLTVLPAPDPAPAPAPATTSWLGLSPAALRWAGVAALLAALAFGIYAQRGIASRRVARSQ
jgi:hypothetical protein